MKIQTSINLENVFYNKNNTSVPASARTLRFGISSQPWPSYFGNLLFLLFDSPQVKLDLSYSIM